MNRTRYIPSIVMLAAAFVACVSTIYFGYSTKQILLIVLAVSVIFLVLGLIIKILAERYLIVSTKLETMEEEQNVDGEQSDKENLKKDSGEENQNSKDSL